MNSRGPDFHSLPELRSEPGGTRTPLPSFDLRLFGKAGTAGQGKAQDRSSRRAQAGCSGSLSREKMALETGSAGSLWMSCHCPFLSRLQVSGGPSEFRRCTPRGKEGVGVPRRERHFDSNPRVDFSPHLALLGLNIDCKSALRQCQRNTTSHD